MANADKPQGFRPYGDVKRASPYTTNAICYPGDALTMSNAGTVGPWSSGLKVIGVAANYAASAAEVMVWDDPDQKFVVQADDGTTLAQTNVGLNYDIVSTAGDSTYRQSRMELDASTGATDSTLPLRLLGVQNPPGEAIGEFAKCVVEVNVHQLAKNIVGL